MQKVGQSTSSANAAGEFTNGNPAAGVEPTQITVGWLNSVQRELINAIAGLGFPLDPNNDAQLLAAIKSATSWGNVSNRPSALLALSRITKVTADATLTPEQMGLVLIDASASTRAVNLPSSALVGVVDVIVRRTDNTENRLTVQAVAGDRIKFHTHLNAAGYTFLVLMGAGDWWHLRSDGQGGWWPVGRFDNTALGRPIFETTKLFSPGGYGAFNGSLLTRTEWPWLWDHAQQSGMIIADGARAEWEGSWTSGDGVLTFRGPDGRGVFLRLLDETRGVDPGRSPGNWQRDAIQNIVGAIQDTGTAIQGAGGAFQTYASGSGYWTGSAVAGADAFNFDASRVVRTANETRPTNVAYPGRIKLI
ncbi:hypothetical protein [Pseudomonas fluorescens]|uniref:hypothetical protein n=1 Tax=Pseudomonas fluorescens TaxID=294 RepID=UPI0007D09F64|nr:hypothetical protein [Pseudomonas fluorescens]